MITSPRSLISHPITAAILTRFTTVLVHPAALYALGGYRRALLSVFCDIASDSESIELLLRGGTAEEEPAQQPESGEPAAGSTAIQ